MVSPSSDGAYCAACDAMLGEDFCRPDPYRVPCPVCGSTARRLHVSVTERAEILETLAMEARRAGLSRRKGWFIRSITKFARQRNRGGGISRVDRVLDRDADRYTETVTMRDTGEVVHQCDEPLSAHRGHGSDKKNRR